MFKVIVIALPGAGKTTILQRVSEQIKDLKLINFGDIMFEEARRSLGIASRTTCGDSWILKATSGSRRGQQRS
jgi:adenylate kinase